MPTAVSCKVEPTAIPTGAVEDDVGVIVMLLRVAELTVRVWDAVTAPRLAPIVVVPAATPAAMPSGGEVVMVAAAVLLLLQFTSPVTSCTVPSLNVPIAVYTRCVRGAIVCAAGATAIVLTVALVTVRVAVPANEVVGSVAVIVALPAVMPRATPILLIVATVAGAEVQVAPVKTRSPPSL